MVKNKFVDPCLKRLLTIALNVMSLSSAIQEDNKLFFSGIVVTKDVSNFVTNILIMAGISLLASACAGLRGGCFMITIQKLNIRVRNALFASVTNQEIGFFDNMKTGIVLSCIKVISNLQFFGFFYSIFINI